MATKSAGPSKAIKNETKVGAQDAEGETKQSGRFALRGKVKDLYDLFMVEDVNGKINEGASCRALHEVLKTAENGFREIVIPSHEELAEDAKQDKLLRRLDFNENGKTDRPYRQRWPQSKGLLKFNEEKRRLEMVGEDGSDQSMPHFLIIKELAESGFGNLDIVFEYVIPGTARRADAMVFWHGADEKKHVLVVELKSWKESDWVNDEQGYGFGSKYQDWQIESDGVLQACPYDEARRPMGKPCYKLEHPLHQALSYSNFLNNFHSEMSAKEGGWFPHSICFLPQIKNFDFLYLGDGCHFAPYREPTDTSGSKYVKSDASGITRLIETAELADTDANGENICAQFLSGEFCVSEKTAEAIARVCEVVSEICAADDPDSRKTFVSELLSGTADSTEKPSSLILVKTQGLIKEKASPFLNSADMAIALQSELLNRGFDNVTVQINHDDLLELQAALKDTNKLQELTKGLRGRRQNQFSEINAGLSFNAFNAYKWEPAVFSTIGIIDFCGFDIEDNDAESDEGKHYRKQAREIDALRSFLKDSIEAKTIFLLVDDETPTLSELEDESLLEGFSVMNWPN